VRKRVRKKESEKERERERMRGSKTFSAIQESFIT
jgi:hypothetical protein